MTSNPEVPGPSRSWSPAPSAPSSPLDLRTRLHRRGYLRRNVIGGAIRLHSGRCPPVAVALSAAEHQAMPGRPWPLQQPGQRPWQPLWPACHVQQPAWSSSCLGFECGCDSSPRALGMAGSQIWRNTLLCSQLSFFDRVFSVARGAVPVVRLGWWRRQPTAPHAAACSSVVR